MTEDRRTIEKSDRRARPRGGRRDHDQKTPWYRKRKLWLATASLLFVGWRRIRTLGRRERGSGVAV